MGDAMRHGDDVPGHGGLQHLQLRHPPAAQGHGRRQAGHHAAHRVARGDEPVQARKVRAGLRVEHVAGPAAAGVVRDVRTQPFQASLDGLAARKHGPLVVQDVENNRQGMVRLRKRHDVHLVPALQQVRRKLHRPSFQAAGQPVEPLGDQGDPHRITAVPQPSDAAHFCDRGQAGHRKDSQNAAAPTTTM